MSERKRKKFPRPRTKKIALEPVRKFLQEKGYAVINLHQQWRHVSGLVRKNNKELFFKMATTIKTGRMTKVEFSWNELVSKNLPPDAPFKVPYGVEKGLYDERLFFFISEYFDSETLADKYPPGTKGLAGWIPVVAKATHIIGNIKQWPKVEGRRQSVGENLVESATEWASQLQSNTEQLLEIIEKSEKGIKEVFNHGDFVPWHMYDLDGKKFGLVDAEHGGWKAKYYDVAYFYLRVRQSLGEKELATRFLLEFVDLLTKQEKSAFWDELRPVLAQRLIGNYWEAEKKHDVGTGVVLQKCEEFKEDLLKGVII
ncbi:aminoglycoside phosphotransferase family protein [Patescibacteria group bacterium]|nr:aminoglycoside phosphotransferase family protein [Patescibacteria group bacterium]